jgi:hypothetical protein
MSHDLDESLQAALRPLDPGETFTQQVMSRIAKEPPRSGWPRSYRAVALHGSWMALAASLVLAIIITHQWEERRTQQGLQARRQLIQALRVTDQKLDLAYRAVKDSQRRALKNFGA